MIIDQQKWEDLKELYESVHFEDETAGDDWIHDESIDFDDDEDENENYPDLDDESDNIEKGGKILTDLFDVWVNFHQDNLVKAVGYDDSAVKHIVLSKDHFAKQDIEEFNKYKLLVNDYPNLIEKMQTEKPEEFMMFLSTSLALEQIKIGPHPTDENEFAKAVSVTEKSVADQLNISKQEAASHISPFVYAEWQANLAQHGIEVRL